MKKLLFVSILTLALLLLPLSAQADEPSLKASVTVSVSVAGEAKAVLASVDVTDTDGDGALTVADALAALHAAAYPNGAAGFSTYQSEYGMSIGTLWGDSSGSFGYYLNDASCLSPADTVKDGDRVYAFVYKDTAGWSDTYAYFDCTDVTVSSGESVTLTLTVLGFDAAWNVVQNPVEGATVTLNGKAIDATTDANGRVTFTVTEGGRFTVSATHPSLVLVPPLCALTVAGEVPEAPTAEEAPSQSAPATEEKKGCAAAGSSAACLLLPLALPLLKKKEQ